MCLIKLKGDFMRNLFKNFLIKALSLIISIAVFGNSVQAQRSRNLVNGGMCFGNSVVQVLSKIGSLNLAISLRLSEDDRDSRDLAILRSYQSMLGALYSGEAGDFNPDSFYSDVKERWLRDTVGHQDAEEFYGNLMDYFTDVCKIRLHDAHSGLFHSVSGDLMKCDSDTCRSVFPLGEFSEHGSELLSRISVPVVSSRDSKVSLDQCFTEYCREEKLDTFKCHTCDAVGTTKKAIKFSNFSDYIVFTFKRAFFDRVSRSQIKIMTPVSCPMESGLTQRSQIVD
jgi:ubiquitin C-terminal hydrolase